MINFVNEKVYDIFTLLEEELKNISLNEALYFTIDLKNSINGYKALSNLVELLFCKIDTIEVVNENIVKVGILKLNKNNSFHNDVRNSEKYGENSTFSKICKKAEPSFVVHYINSLKRAKIEKRYRVLNLGINKADEFELIDENFPDILNNIEFIGVDYSKSAIKIAKEKFRQKENFKFYSYDINSLDELNLGEFDLIITIGTLQSKNIDFKLTFMSLVQKYLKKDGAIILGFPNCRWIDGEMIYGAKMPTYSFSEQTLLYKDVYFCKKYLQQKKFVVTLTGKEYLFLTATALIKD